MNKTLLIKYISGSSSSLESDKVLAWINESEENERYFIRLMNLWISQNMPDEKASDNEVKDIMRAVRIDKPGDKSNPNPNRRFIVWAAAASVLFILSLGLWFITVKPMNNEEVIAYAPYNYEVSKMAYVDKGVKGRVILPDSSVVWLNSDSRLYYPESFTGNTREVVLSGEGFFEVRHDAERPMIVSTNKDFRLEVLGTTFNLKSYDNDDTAEATLYAGLVNVILNNPNGAPSVKMLQPNQTVVIEKNYIGYAKTPVEQNVQAAWKEGKIIFSNTPMSEVVKILNRWHGVDFVVKDKDILNYKITARFNAESIVQIMDLLRLTSFIDYEIENNKTVHIMKR